MWQYLKQNINLFLPHSVDLIYHCLYFYYSLKKNFSSAPKLSHKHHHAHTDQIISSHHRYRIISLNVIYRKASKELKCVPAKLALFLWLSFCQSHLKWQIYLSDSKYHHLNALHTFHSFSKYIIATKSTVSLTKITYIEKH